MKVLKVIILSLLFSGFVVANSSRADLEAKIADVKLRIESYENNKGMPGLSEEVVATIERSIDEAKAELAIYEKQLEELED